MKSVLLIGLGRFGWQMAEKLQELRHEVLAVDREESRVNDILPLVTNAQIGDGTNEAFIASLGVRNFDLCVVAIGDDFQSSLETTALLRSTAPPSFWPGPAARSTRNSSGATGPTTWSTRKSRWPAGPPSATARSTSSITSP